VAAGTASGTLRRFPLIYQGPALGALVVGPRRGEETPSPADERLLAHLAQQAGVAVHGVRLMADLRRLSADLQRSRERLVRAREEERRRGRRPGSYRAGTKCSPSSGRHSTHRSPSDGEAPPDR
jgi:hypothetical protein